MPRLNLNLRIKTVPVMAGTDATVYVYMYGLCSVHKSQKYSVASNPVVTGSVFMRRLKLFVWQCTDLMRYKLVRTHLAT